jgi:hypothetical protein
MLSPSRKLNEPEAVAAEARGEATPIFRQGRALPAKVGRHGGRPSIFDGLCRAKASRGARPLSDA